MQTMHADEEEVFSLILLNRIPGLSNQHIHNLIAAYGSGTNVVKQRPDSWRDVIIDSDWVESLESKFDGMKVEAESELSLARKLNVRFFLRHRGGYPSLLAHILNPPPLLYVRGEVDVDVRDAIAVVGSRRPSYYGEKMARIFSRDLAESGVITVSGLARGVDSVVHKETLEAGGRTWAVVGCGLSQCYPPENHELMAKIMNQGAVISEFPLDTSPFPGNFPRRNRIIAGLTLGTIVVEGSRKSGSLITARLAAEEGRDVFALPGLVTSPLSEAPHFLIQAGAKLIQSMDDVWAEFPELKKAEKRNLSAKITLTVQQEELIKLLTAGPLSKEIVALKLNRTPSEIAVLLLEMELAGLVKVEPSGHIVSA